MLIDLTASVTFPTTGKTLSHTISFEPGLTAITGENGAGKTFIGSEVPRWLLFGVSALRETKSEYQDLSGTMRFRIGETTYTVSRSPTAERLVDDQGTLLALGASAVNQKVAELFGYGLGVFDLANAGLQGEIKRLTQMTPAERKTTVDRLIGLDTIEQIEKQCRDEGKTLAREADALASQLRPLPPRPVAPDGYQPSSELEILVEEQNRVARERGRLQGVIASVGPLPGPLPDLEAAQRGEERARLEAELAAIPRAQFSEQQIAESEAYHQASSLGPRPTMTLQEIEAIEAAWANHLAWRPVEPCPECGYGADQQEQPFRPQVSQNYLREQRVHHSRWEGKQMPPTPAVLVPAGQIAAARRALVLAERRDELEAQLASLPIYTGPDLATAMRAHAAAEAHAERAKAAAKAEAELALLPQPDDTVRLRLRAAEQFERELQIFTRDEEQHQRLSAQIAERQQQSEGFLAGARALKEVRLEVKSHIAPAISAVGSELVVAMSNGAFQKLEVSPDFEVRMDGQTVRSLSGSEAAIANLALRLALGRVLTSRVFPVFIGDEIDSEMSQTRSEATAEAMRGLSRVLQQVILITHKKIEADHHIEL